MHDVQGLNISYFVHGYIKIYQILSNGETGLVARVATLRYCCYSIKVFMKVDQTILSLTLMVQFYSYNFYIF